MSKLTLAGTIPVAHARVTDEPAGHHAGRPSTQGQVGEAWRQRSVGSGHDRAAEDTLGRVLARERLSAPSGTAAQSPAPAPAQPRESGWVLATIVALAVGLPVAALNGKDHWHPAYAAVTAPAGHRSRSAVPRCPSLGR